MDQQIRAPDVEHDPDLGDRVSAFLQREDDRIDVRTTTNPADACEILAEEDFDCIVADYDMPGQNGIEFLETVRKEDSDLPFILYTGKGSEEIASKAISAGVTDYLQKKTDQYTVLANHIRKYVERYRAAQQSKEVQESSRTFQEKLTELSINLLQSERSDIDTKIDETLEKIGTLVEADRSYVFQVNHETKTLSNTHEWCAEGVEPQIDTLQDVDLDSFPWLFQKLQSFENVKIPDVSELPPEAEELQRVLRKQNIFSLIVAPMVSNGTLVGFIGFDWIKEKNQWPEEFTDILRMAGQLIASALRRTERDQELTELKERLELALEAANLGVWDWDMETDEVYRDERWAGMLGYEPGEVGGEIMDFKQMAHPKDLGPHRKALNAHIEGDAEFYKCEYRLRTATGSWKWIQNLGKVIERDEDGEPVRSIGIHLDIHDRKQREIKLEQFREAVEQTAHAVYITDREGTIEFVNPAFEDITGYSKDEAVGRNPRILKSGKHGDAFYEELWDTILSGNRWNREIIDERADDDQIVLNQSISPITTGGEEPVKFVAVAQDTTERKEYEQKLEDQRDNLEMLNQVVRHDIRNKLQLVRAYAQTLQSKVDEDGGEQAEQVLKAAREANNITETAKDVTEIMLQPEADRLPVKLRDILEAETDNVRSGYTNVTISIHGSIPDVKVLADDMLESVFRNLLNNAIQHNDKEVPEVTISGTRDGENVVVQIADNGPGIADDHKDIIFARGEVGLNSDGTGLGLYLVKTLVDRYEGDVRVEDNEPEGTVFAVELPIAENASKNSGL